MVVTTSKTVEGVVDVLDAGATVVVGAASARSSGSELQPTNSAASAARPATESRKVDMAANSLLGRKGLWLVAATDERPGVG